MTGTGTWSFLQTQEPGVSFKPDNKQLQQNISCAWKFSPGTTTVNHGKNRKLTNTQKTNHNRPEPQPQWVKVFCNSLPATGDTTSALIHNCWQCQHFRFDHIWGYWFHSHLTEHFWVKTTEEFQNIYTCFQAPVIHIFTKERCGYLTGERS